MENENNSLNLSLSDLAQARDIINLACTRGAFKGNEMRAVGELFDKLDTFVNLTISRAKSAEQANSDDTLTDQTDSTTQGESK